MTATGPAPASRRGDPAGPRALPVTVPAPLPVVAAAVARVHSVAVYPLKGADGSPVESVLLDGGGVVGDRRHVALDDEGRVLTADRAPQLRAVAARLDGGRLRLDVDGIARDLAGADAEAALSAFLGRSVQVVAVPAGSQLDAPVHLVSVQAVAAARRGEHESSGCACSLEEPRANLVLDLDGPGAREEDLVGLTLAVGTARLRVRRRPGHCLGVYAEVLRPGRVTVGDAVQVGQAAVEGVPAPPEA